jgi:hypothetical protein
MTYRLSDAIRRADLSLAGAIFLSLGTAAAVTAYYPIPLANAPSGPKVLTAIDNAMATFRPSPVKFEAAPTAGLRSAVYSPDVVPAPRPKSIFSRLKIQVALENLAGETSCLAEALYYEARGQGVLGQKAIAEVVVRRTHRSGFPHSICGVVHQGTGNGCQFSFVCDGTMDRPKATGEWNHAVRLAAKIITGAMPLTNITQGAISFHASTLEADWPGMVPTVTIGHNVFYRRPGQPSAS